MIKKIVLSFFSFIMIILLIIMVPVMAITGGGASQDLTTENKDYLQSEYGFMNPLDKITITNDWGEFSAITNYDTHPAVDMACSVGDELVSATDATVIQAGFGWDPYGAMTLLFRPEKNPQMIIQYAHISKVLVKQGDIIKKGQVIAECGSTGISSGPHLHLQVDKAGKPVDPNLYFKLK